MFELVRFALVLQMSIELFGENVGTFKRDVYKCWFKL